MPSNLDIQQISTGVGTNETAVPHTLGRTPLDAFVVRKTANANVFRGATAWSSTTVYLQASASVTVTLLLF